MTHPLSGRVRLCAIMSALTLFLVPLGLCEQDRPEQSTHPFAMCSNGHIRTNPAYSEKMLDAGATMCRVDITFPGVRRESGDDPDKWDWTAMEQLRALRKTQPKLDWLVLLGYGAPWAEDPKFKDAPGGNCSGPQSGIEATPVNDPKNLYGHYVYETIKRYKDVTQYWESWNEPDLPGHHYFKGSGKDFFPYQKACYLAAKKADPECTVLFAGLCYASFEGYLATHGLKPPTPYPPNNCFFEDYLKECIKDPEAKRHNYYFDIMNQHSYSRATDLYDYVAVDRKLMQDYLGEQKPIWVTEMGSTDRGEGPFAHTPEHYCDYMLQSFVWGSLAGVEKFFHFQLDNSNGHGLYTGMLGEPKPALLTYRDVLVKELAGAKLVKQLHGSKGVGFLDGKSPFTGGGQDGHDLFQFESRDGKRRIFVAFADTAKPVTVKIPAARPEATLIGRHNKRTKVRATNGSYEVTLEGATSLKGWPIADNPKAKALGNPEHLVGGATVILVEGR